MHVEKPFPLPLATSEESFKLDRYVIICNDNILIKKRAGITAILWSS